MENLHNRSYICSLHEEEHEHSHDKQYRQIFQVFLIFHMRRVGEAYCPSHQLQLFEAAKIVEEKYL